VDCEACSPTADLAGRDSGHSIGEHNAASVSLECGAAGVRSRPSRPRARHAAEPVALRPAGARGDAVVCSGAAGATPHGAADPNSQRRDEHKNAVHPGRRIRARRRSWCRPVLAAAIGVGLRTAPHGPAPEAVDACAEEISVRPEW